MKEIPFKPFTNEEIKEIDNKIIQTEYEKLFSMIEDYYNKHKDLPVIRFNTATLIKCEKYNAIDDNIHHIK